MKLAPHADKCLSFIGLQVNPQSRQAFVPPKLRPVITISRQCGVGAMAIAAELAEFLRTRAAVSNHWTVFDKNIVGQVLEEHKLPKEIAQFMPEDRVSAIQDAVEELLGLHPSSRSLWQQSSETILHLADLGHVILIGRGANIITREMPQVFHVRLVAPLEQRVQQVMQQHQLDHKAGLAFVRKQDQSRKRYLKDFFHTDIDDDLQYDLVINVSRLPHQVVARLIGETVLQWAETL